MDAKRFAALCAQIEAENLAAGKCPKCGGSGVVAAMRAIERTRDPHLNTKCRACKGTGKPKVRNR
jgi:DnaJ-class molecular chaperone